jgi:hypothetical protein
MVYDGKLNVKDATFLSCNANLQRSLFVAPMQNGKSFLKIARYLFLPLDFHLLSKCLKYSKWH